jgi:hypothetical protein
MLRFTLMSRLGLAEPLVRLQRRLEASNRAAAAAHSGEAHLRPQLRLDGRPSS